MVCSEVYHRSIFFHCCEVNERKGYKKKIGQTTVIRQKAWSDKCTDQPQFIHNQILLYPILSVPLLFLPAPPSPAHCLISWHSPTNDPPTSPNLRPASLPVWKSWFACSLMIRKINLYTSISMTDKCFSCLCLHYVFLSGLCLQIFCLCFSPFPWCHIWQGCQSGNLTEVNIPAFGTPL